MINIVISIILVQSGVDLVYLFFPLKFDKHMSCCIYLNTSNGYISLPLVLQGDGGVEGGHFPSGLNSVHSEPRCSPRLLT